MSMRTENLRQQDEQQQQQVGDRGC
jgi:hypothetical protein